MAVDKTGSGSTTRRPSLRGSALSYVRRGTEITASWPKKRGVSKSQAEQDRRNFFTAVQFAYRRLEPCTKIMLRDATAGTPLLPRDLWLSMCAGRFATIGLPNGKVVFSVANLRNTSKILDVVAQDEGDLLVRGHDYWEALAPGSLNQMLISGGPGNPPEWVDQPIIPPPPPSGALVKLAQQRLSAAAPTITFAAIPQTATDLILAITGRLSTAAQYSNVFMRLNADNGIKYSFQEGWNSNATFQGDALTNQDHAVIGDMQTTGGPGSAWNTIEVTISDYTRAAGFHDWWSHGGVKGANIPSAIYLGPHWGDYQENGAIHEIDLYLPAGNFLTGTVATLYGRG